jgi:hypothetical protein
MKYFLLIVFFIAFHQQFTNAQTNTHFTNEALRIDFTLSGNATNTQAAIFELKKEPYWGGSPMHQDAFDYGEFKIIVRDSTNNEILFSRGFCTLFEEWQTTDEAQSIYKSFQQSIRCPFPKEKISVCIERRGKNGKFHELLNTKINPADYAIIHTSIKDISTMKTLDNGSSNECVDIVFIGDGYTEEQMNKFHEDVQRMTDFFFSQAPFNELKKHFNIWVVDAISQDSGITDPRKNRWKETVLKSSFNTLNSDRYLESTHTYTIYDYAGLVPYDQIYVIANTKKYGGGGIYNHFSLTSVDNPKSSTVFVHEFGHAFAGLGDEYYTSETSYNDYYNQTIEPWQPNLTTMLDFDSKWKHMIDKSTPIPTPGTEEYFNKVGVFEGGGYVAKGIYRPSFDCRMKTNEAENFCPVCQKAIEDMVMFLIGK